MAVLGRSLYCEQRMDAKMCFSPSTSSFLPARTGSLEDSVLTQIPTLRKAPEQVFPHLGCQMVVYYGPASILWGWHWMLDEQFI